MDELTKIDGYKLDADRGERLQFSDAEFVVKASADTTAGAFTIIEEVAPLDTPLHAHKNEDELFYVLEGEHVFQCGGRGVPCRPRWDGVRAPRRSPCSPTGSPADGRFLTMTYPAGFEGFFRELAEAERAGSSMPEPYARVTEKYGVIWLDN